MAIVTYIPRALPAVVLNKFHIPTRIERFLNAIPYAALGSLIFPGILSVEKGNPVVGIIGGTVAIVLSIFKLNISFVISGSVFTVIALKMLGV